MRIGLIGAPGAGKTSVAWGLSEAFKLGIIDDYVEELASETDLALGYLADFVPNLLVVSERLKRELTVEKDYVICGTPVESLGYIALLGARMIGVQPQNRNAIMQEARVATDSVILYMATGWAYDHVFYLPLGGKSQDKDDQRLDLSIRDALAMLGIDHVTLDEEDQVTQAINHVRSRNELTTTVE